MSRVADEAVGTAERILRMVVRAFDYLPVVDVTFGDAVQAIVTADRDLYPDDLAHLRARLVESLRRRGIYADEVTSLADEALSWPPPTVDLTLSSAGSTIDLAGIISSATRDLDVHADAGEMGPSSLDRAIGEDGATLARSDAGKQLYLSFSAWAKEHALVLGLDPTAPIALEGLHVSFRHAADRQPDGGRGPALRATP